MLPLCSFAARRRLAMTGFGLHANLLMPGFDQSDCTSAG